MSHEPADQSYSEAVRAAIAAGDVAAVIEADGDYRALSATMDVRDIGRLNFGPRPDTPYPKDQPMFARRDPRTDKILETVTFDGVKLSDVRSEKVNWYIDGLIPKSLHTVLAAPGGTVKGLFALYLAAHHIPGTILYLGSEDDFALILRPRAEALGMDVDRFVPLFAVVQDPDGAAPRQRPMRFPSDKLLLEAAIDHYGASAIIVDSGIEHMDDGLAANRAEDVRRVTSMFNTICRERRVLALDILHTNKSRDARGVDRVGHAKTWTDASRHVLMAAADDQDENIRHVEVFKTNIGTRGYGRRYRIEEAPVVVFDPDTDADVETMQPYLSDEGESDKSVEELLNVKAPEGDAQTTDEAILAYLVAEGVPVESDALDAYVSEAASCSKRTARDHRMQLNRRGLTSATPGIRDEHGRVRQWFTTLTVEGEETARSDW